MRFINELISRNRTLFWYGTLNFAAAAICLVLSQTTNVCVNNVNAFIKPLKFYLSIATFCWTIGYIMHHLHLPARLKVYNVMAIIVFTYESFVITWQAANGRLSHFNVSSPLYLVLFNLMGVAIVLLTLWTGYIGYLFFRKRDWALPISYIWGIRLGILCFVFFALEGGVMGPILRHTIGGQDGGKGLPFLNWSLEHGDLRVAHFLGMHSLQIFPIVGYYLAKSKQSIIAFCCIYVLIVIAVLVRALMGLPL
jgi:hypothetical protein